MILGLLTKQVPQRHVEHIDLVSHLREADRPVEAALDGLDLGVVAIDGDEVEVPLVSPSTMTRARVPIGRTDVPAFRPNGKEDERSAAW